MGVVVPATLTVEEPQDVALRCYPNGKLGGLTIDGKAPGPVGVYVELVVQVRRPARAFRVRGQLAWARHKTAGGQVPSYGVDFLPEDDAARVRLLAFARNEVHQAAIRFEPRLHVEWPVRLRHRGAARREFIADLSSTGAFIRSWEPLDAGEAVELLVRPPLSVWRLALRGRVMWRRVTGNHPGMGIEFIQTDREQRDRLEKLMASLSVRP